MTLPLRSFMKIYLTYVLLMIGWALQGAVPSVNVQASGHHIHNDIVKNDSGFSHVCWTDVERDLMTLTDLSDNCDQDDFFQTEHKKGGDEPIALMAFYDHFAGKDSDLINFIFVQTNISQTQSPTTPLYLLNRVFRI